MPDVILVNPPCTEDTPAVPHEVGEPIGLCYLAAALRDRGVSTAILDGFTLGLSVAQLVEAVREYGATLCVGVSVLETSAMAAACFVRELRRSGFSGHICAGNYYPTLNPERTFKLAPDLDSIIRGEGEQIFPELVDFLRRDDDGWRNLQGVGHVQNGNLVDNGLAPQPTMDEIIEPVRDCLSQTLDAGGTANLVTGRGCYANCSFCSIVAFTGAAGKRFRVRNEAAVVGEMARLSRDFGLRRFLIPDDNFMLPGKHRAPRVHALCDAVEASRLDAEFTITCRADDIHDDLIERLKASGLVGIYLGIESFQPRRLKFFNKGLKPEANFRAFDILDRNGIFVKIGFIMFDPFVTVDEVIDELKIFQSRVGCPTVIHTSIDNLIRHSTYPLELQAGTPVQKKMTAMGRTFDVGPGFGFCFDFPESYALMRFAEGLLRFEGPTFAPLRALSYRLSFGEPLEDGLHDEIEQSCTALWKQFGAAHFASYLDVARKIGPLREWEPGPIADIINALQGELYRIQLEAFALIHRARLNDLERPWVRFIDLDQAKDRGRVYDPAKCAWYVMNAAERAVLRLWSRTPPAEIEGLLAAEYGTATAREAVASIFEKIDQGGFVGTRGVEAPLSVEQFAVLIDEVVRDLRLGRVGPRPGDFQESALPELTEQAQ